MDEFSYIDKWKQKTYRNPTTYKGIGDDAAVSAFPNEQVVTAVDTFVDGVHFTKQTMSAYAIGYRSLSASISDIIAMGANPTSYLVSIVIPLDWHNEQLQSIYEGMDDLAGRYNIDLIGGDTTSGKEFVLSITVLGTERAEQIRYRHDAVAGDLVFVTGTLGDSRAGLEVLLSDMYKNHPNKDDLIEKHRKPFIRSSFIKELKHIKRLAVNDISDGVANECHEIAEASSVSIILQDESIPLSRSMSYFPLKDQHEWKYFGGEDYELVCTASMKDWSEIERLAHNTNTQVTIIGRVVEAREERVYVEKNNNIDILHKDGYIHLKLGDEDANDTNK